MNEHDPAVAAAANLLLRHIVHRVDVHARQSTDGRYVLYRQPINQAVVVRHVLGHQTVGVYQLDRDRSVKWIVFDLDRRRDDVPMDDLQALFADLVEWILRSAAGLQLRGCVEFSGRRGYHVWIIFDQPIPAEQARQLAFRILGDGQSADGLIGIEVFPKQVALGLKGLGNSIKLPLGRHQLGTRSEFVNPDLSPLHPQGTWLQTQVAFLRQLPLNPIRSLEVLVREHPAAPVPVPMPEAEPEPASVQTEPIRASQDDWERTLDLLQRDPLVRDLFRGEPFVVARFPSRSEAEWRLCVRLLELDVPGAHVRAVMSTAAIGKWRSSPQQYAEITLRKTTDWVRKRRARMQENLRASGQREPGSAGT